MQTEDAMLEQLLDLCDSVTALARIAIGQVSRFADGEPCERWTPSLAERAGDEALGAA